MKNSELTYKEIYGQPVSFQAVNDTLDTIFKTRDEVFAEKNDEVIFTGCGTSLYLAQASAHAFSTCTGISAKGMCCSELYYFPETYVGNGKKVLVVPMTRKRYTTEVRMAIDKVKKEAIRALRALRSPVMQTAPNTTIICCYPQKLLRTT
ncbi:MAG: hypothetical protein V8S98_14035 [Lachnospiraceae bacterium]